MYNINLDEFVPIKGFPEYSINENGTVISFKRKNPRRLKPSKCGLCGVHYVTLFDEDGGRHSRGLNSLVFENFGHPIAGHKTRSDYIYELADGSTFNSLSSLARHCGRNREVVRYHLQRYGTTPLPIVFL